MKLLSPLSLFISLVFMSCSTYTIDDNVDTPTDNPINETKAEVRVSIADWEHILSRGETEDFSPIYALFVPDSELNVAYTIKCTDDNYTMQLESGTYDVFAICGLPTNNIPRSISDNITFPNGDKGKKCIAIGSIRNQEIAANVQNVININTKRQNSWISLKLTEVPDIVRSIKFYIIGLYDTYTLDKGWELSADGANVYTSVPLIQNASLTSTYECDWIVNPCLNTNGVKYGIEVHTINNKASFYEYTSPIKLEPGKHHEQTIAFTQLSLANGNITIEDWGSSSDSGTVTDKLIFKPGDRYFAYPATVLQSLSTGISVFPHKAMTVKLAEVKAWTDFASIDYSLLPDLEVTRWGFPTKATAPNALISMIQTKGLDEINKQLQDSGNPEISASATNILAYYDNTNDKFYRYDFDNLCLVAIDGFPTTDYLLYPFGLIEF